MSIFKHFSYKALFLEEAKSRSISFVEFAKAAKVQKPYVSMVLKGDAHFNEDQGYNVGVRLGFAKEEIGFGLLLIRENRASQPELKKLLKDEINSIQESKLKLAQRVPKESRLVQSEIDNSYVSYYLEIENQILHMHLLVHRRVDEKLIQRLNLSLQEVADRLDYLENIGLIKRTGTTIKVTQDFIHLQSGSSLSKQNHVNWRNYALGFRNFAKDDYRLTSTMVGSALSKTKLIEGIKELMARFQHDLKDDADEIVFQMNCDVMSIS